MGQIPYNWSLATGSGPLPAGFELASNGTLWGTPSAAGKFDFVLRVADTLGTFTDKPFSLTVTSGAGGGLTLGSLEVLPDGRFRFRIQSANTPTCSIFVSINLVEWTPLGPAVSEGNGTWTYTDPDAAQNSMRFYRAVSQ